MKFTCAGSTEAFSIKTLQPPYKYPLFKNNVDGTVKPSKRTLLWFSDGSNTRAHKQKLLIL